MEVDLLRPGTVPISPETVLWFEFLLDQELLFNHLRKPSPDPTPIELILKFSDVVVETFKNRTENDNGEQINVELTSEKIHPSAKITALKILSMKVAAFIKWDLGQLRLLPFKTQVTLIQDLLYFTNNKSLLDIPLLEDVYAKTDNPQFLFALVIYHRWMLNVTMHRITTNWQIRIGSNDISPNEETVICTPENVDNTVKFLTNSLNWEKIPDMLTFDCFKLPTESSDNIELDWSHSQSMVKGELSSQINFELGTFFFYKEDYAIATQHFKTSDAALKSIKINNGFVNFDVEVLQVYLRACCGPFDQLNISIVNHYMGITGILQRDNISKQIPLAYRINLELDIQGALSSGTFTVARDLLIQVKALNLVRCILEKKPIDQYSVLFTKHVDNIIWAIRSSWKTFSDSDRSLVKLFLINSLLKKEIVDLPELIQAFATLPDLFDKSELQFLYSKKTDSEIKIPPALDKTDFILFDFSKKKKPKLQLKQLVQRLITTYDQRIIRDLLANISLKNVGTSVWSMNPQWELPIPLQSVLQSLPRGFLQDFAFVMLAKSKEQMLNKNWNLSLEMLVILDKEIQSAAGNLAKLSQMVKWEILLVQISQLVQEWPKTTIDKIELANACELCLQSNETVLPRSEIAEQCVICLLNLGRWEFLITFDKRRASCEISSAIALTCQELVKHKGNKKFPKALWDLVLPIFSNNGQSKRNGIGSAMYHDSFIVNLKANIMTVFSQLRANMALSMVISMLTKLYNILRDEPSVELQMEYIILWPATLSNIQSYNSKAVCEVLSQIVTQALDYYPTNVPWLRLMGDINFGTGHYKLALKDYLQSILILTDYFNAPIRNDDHAFRRMIKCCTALGCFTQAAVLCQFLEEPDYVLAFRILGEQKTGNDAVDAYYHCFWDTNILEYLVHTHNKKGEFQRRKCAIQVIGLLELNSSNNEEIQREASNLRKSTFLRALCKQYVF